MLTGAGFSRNWGGWLASETFEYLLGCRELNEWVRSVLWECYDNRTGFEGALAKLQQASFHDQNFKALTAAIRGMFDLMNDSFPNAVGPDIGSGHPAAKFLSHFDAIFTLNQDLLLEKGYAPTHPHRWNGMHLPGTKPLDPTKGLLSDLRIADDSLTFKLASNFQPYFKLHGSSAFRYGAEAEDALLIMGGNKLSGISGSELLTWYREEFERHLLVPDTHFMVIGYSFSDDHINRSILDAVKANPTLRIFIIDTAGVDVIDNKRPKGNGVITPRRDDRNYEVVATLTPVIAGASRRGFRDIFGYDKIERAKVCRFIGMDPKRLER